ncbi:MAG: DUF4238 domain-containing protein [Methylobacter tundripaludum]|nr:DUF4238 domain-containing protein [Methylobacter tundripaludum]
MTNNIKPIKSERHHWWPQGVSKRWLNDEGVIYQLFSDGRNDIPQTNTKKFGVIRNAHSIKLADKPTVWDQSFEGIFQFADRAFPDILDWLESLHGRRVDALQEDQEKLDILLECLLSLVVRSPRFRNSIKLTIEHFGATANEKVINLNLRDTFDKFKTSLFGRGKFAVVFSSEQEFIFGDGFYHNFTSSIGVPMEPRIIVPILPNICIFYSCPTSYKTDSRLLTMDMKEDDIDFINQTTMVYSRDYIFYRLQRPEFNEYFSCQQFLEYGAIGDPVINTFAQIFK